MPDYYIALDSGGTKLSAILFDDNFRVIERYCGAGVNTNSRSVDETELTIAECMAVLLGGREEILRIDCILGWCMFSADSFLREARRYVKCGGVHILSEGAMGAYACGVMTDAVTVLSGTGSGVFYLSDGNTVDWIGGWGALIGDDGSGFAVGRDLLRRAIAAQEAEKDEPIIDEICMRYGADTLREATNRIYAKPSAVSEIASLSRLVAERDAAGDLLCREIMRQAGAELGWQVLCIYKRNSLSADIPLCLAGGLLLSNTSIKDSMCDFLSDAGLHLSVYEPALLPEEGVAAYVFYRANRRFDREDYIWITKRLHGEL